jgi:hypothetical protein
MALEKLRKRLTKMEQQRTLDVPAKLSAELEKETMALDLFVADAEVEACRLLIRLYSKQNNHELADAYGARLPLLLSELEKLQQVSFDGI